MSMPFERLLEIERRVSEKASALPAFDQEENEWLGIGFRLGDTELMSRMGEVKEILDPPEYTRVPGVKPWVVGVANVRGSLLPLMDLQGYVKGENLKNINRARVLVIDYKGMDTGVLVDEVLGLRHFSMDEQASKIPGIDQSFRPYVNQAFRREDNYWPVFSFDALTKDESFLNASL